MTMLTELLHTSVSGRRGKRSVRQYDGCFRLDAAGQRRRKHVVDQAGRLQKPV